MLKSLPKDTSTVRSHAGFPLLIAIIVAFLLVAGALAACSGQPAGEGDGDGPNSSPVEGGGADNGTVPDDGADDPDQAGDGEGSASTMNANTVTPPEGATLVGFKYTHMGMYHGPLISVRQVEGGYDAAVTFGEIYWEAMDGKDMFDYMEKSADGTYGFEPYTSYGDPYLGTSEDTRQLLTDQDMAALLDIILEHNALAWDGYDERWSPPEGLELTDSGDTVDMRILFSDGTVVHMHGVDTEPNGFGPFITDVFNFFEAHGVQIF